MKRQPRTDSMIEQLIQYDKELFQFLNSFHTPWLDPLMLFLTATRAWLPLYIFLIYLIIKEFKKDSWMILLGVVITIVLADQITSSIMKPYFARLRPSREPTLEGLVHIVEGYTGGQFGFASSHAASTFGTATFFFLLFRKTKRWIGWLFLWAALMTYTRIYLGVHYPGDVIVGGIVGATCGWIGFQFSEWLRRRNEMKKTPTTT
jgi:undecaprenyl-diphosphatase